LEIFRGIYKAPNGSLEKSSLVFSENLRSSFELPFMQIPWQMVTEKIAGAEVLALLW
jgi:hypothetical protein